MLTCDQITADGVVEMLYIHVLFVAPLRIGHMAQTCADEHQRGVAIGKSTDHPFAVEALDGLKSVGLISIPANGPPRFVPLSYQLEI